MAIKGKTALITGSTSGIGRGLALRFASEGVNIALNGLGEKNEIGALKKEIESKGVKCLYNSADMMKPAEIEALVDETHDTFGSVDILINNAGIQKVSAVDELPLEKWNQIIGINLSSCFHTTRKVLPIMKAAKWGRIINIASGHGLVASPFKAAYIASKHGVVGFTKAVGIEVAETGITVNAICPGYVRTALVENQIADTARERNMSKEQVINEVMLKAQWTRKFVTIEQLAGLAVFLCSDDAANMTGTAIPVDGGWTAS